LLIWCGPHGFLLNFSEFSYNYVCDKRNFLIPHCFYNLFLLVLGHEIRTPGLLGRHSTSLLHFILNVHYFFKWKCNICKEWQSPYDFQHWVHGRHCLRLGIFDFTLFQFSLSYMQYIFVHSVKWRAELISFPYCTSHLTY
jgi:hypothetical protein